MTKKDLKKTKLSITGSFGFMDIGDEAMLSEDLYFIINSIGIPKENIYLFGGDREYISYYHEHPLDNCFNDSWLREDYKKKITKKNRKQRIISAIKKKGSCLFNVHSEFIQNESSDTHVWLKKKQKALEALYSSDAVLVTGGGTINTRDRDGRSLDRMHKLITLFAKLKKPIFMSGQTIGPLGLYRDHDKIAHEIVNSVEVLTVRDSLYSKRYLKVIDCKPKKLVETFDDAYTLSYKNETLPDEIRGFIESKETFAINITDYIADMPEQKKFMANLCEELIKTYDVNIVLVSHTLKDYYSLNIIRDMIVNCLKQHVILPDTRYWHDKKLKKLISSCRLAIGGRYHFIVFAGTSNTPFIGLCGNHYSYIKQDGFARALGMENYILTEKETWELPIIHSRIHNALQLNLNLENKFKRPSISMKIFEGWLNQIAIN